MKGKQLILENVPDNLELAVKNSPTNFFRPDHPLLGKVIAGDHVKTSIAQTTNILSIQLATLAEKSGGCVELLAHCQEKMNIFRLFDVGPAACCGGLGDEWH